MKAKELILKIQTDLEIPEEKRFPRIGPLTRGCLARLSLLPPEADYRFSPEQEGDVTTLGHLGPEGARDICERAIRLIHHFEGCQLKAYLDSVGVWTIGWGHTGLSHRDGTVHRGRVISQEKADQLFRYDMEQFEARVSSLVKVSLSDDQYGALVAFDFNTGGLGRSTLLKKLNRGDYAGAADQFLLWDKAGGRRLNGLTRRRHSERRLFLGEEHYILATMKEVNQLRSM